MYMVHVCLYVVECADYCHACTTAGVGKCDAGQCFEGYALEADICDSKLFELFR